MGSIRRGLAVVNSLKSLSGLQRASCFSPSPQLLSRNFAIFPDTFIHPIFREADQLKIIEDGESSKYAFLPVKPAKTEDTASVFYDSLCNKVVNHIMREGNKSLGRQLLEKTFETMKRIQLDKYYSTTDQVEREKIILNPWKLLHMAVENGRPILQTIPVKRGGHTYQVPIPVRKSASYAISIKWLIEASKDKDDDMRFYKKFAYEIIECANGSGRVIKRKQDMHKVCEANRAYAHYRWS